MKNNKIFILTILTTITLSLTGCNDRETAALSETVPETLAETLPETMTEALPETLTETMPETMTETMTGTLPETVSVSSSTEEESSAIPECRLTVPLYLQGIETEGFSIVEESEESVTYQLTEQQQTKAAKQIEAQIKDSISQVLADKDYYPDITGISVNKDCSEFDVTFSGTEINIYEETLRMSLFIAGDKFQLYQGTSENDLLTVVNYINDATGKIFTSGDSSSLH